MDRDKNGQISKGEFLNNVKNFPQLIRPVFDVHMALCIEFGGEEFWKQHCHERANRLKDKKVSRLFRGIRKRKAHVGIIDEEADGKYQGHGHNKREKIESHDSPNW